MCHLRGRKIGYKVALEELEPDRELYLAIPEPTYQALFGEVLIQKVLAKYPMKLIVYTTDTEEIHSWIV